jgi:hypothetical protein
LDATARRTAKRVLAVLLLGLAPAGVWSAPAAAQAADCARYDKILSDLKNAYSVPQDDINWALQVERSNRCPATAPRPAAPTAASQPALPQPATGGGSGAQAHFNTAMRYGPQGTRPPADAAQYARWMRMAADQGHVTAQEKMAEIHEKGWGVAVNHAEAARWNARAAQNGSAWATLSLAVQYAIGEGVPRDRARAAQLYRYPAEQGDPFAQFLLGVAYSSADGVPLDFQQARYWLQKSAAQNYDGAAERLAAVNASLARQSSGRTTGTVTARSAPASGPSIADQASETLRRQRAENCAAAAAGRDRVCIRD